MKHTVILFSVILFFVWPTSTFGKQTKDFLVVPGERLKQDHYEKKTFLFSLENDVEFNSYCIHKNENLFLSGKIYAQNSVDDTLNTKKYFKDSDVDEIDSSNNSEDVKAYDESQEEEIKEPKEPKESKQSKEPKQSKGKKNKNQPTIVLPWQDYEEGSSTTLAVYLTDPNCSWTTLAHGLKTIGVPFIITSNLQNAIAHPVIMLFPATNTSFMETTNYYAIEDYVRNGGVLIGNAANGLALQNVFGYTTATEVKNVNSVVFKNPKFKFDILKDPFEKTVVVHKQNSDLHMIGTIKYEGDNLRSLANYDDGSIAIFQNNFRNGKAYSFGVDIGSLLNVAYLGKQTDIARSYVNRFEPTADVFLRLIKEIYREAGGITLSTAPNGKHLSVVISHDIDFTKSVQNSLYYADFEKSAGIKATYFMQTKYVKDWEDSAFFTKDNIEILKKIQSMGMEIASHSVAHSMSFKNFERGDNEENINNYHPFIQSRFETKGGTVFGELRVSKTLLDSLVGGSVVSFRPGHLLYPHNLPQCLVETGYKYSSSMTANDALSHLPFQQNLDRDVVKEVPVFEFPVTIEDEEGVLGDRINQSIELANQINNENGLVVILIHPNVTDHKLEFEKKFVTAFKEKAWFGTMKDFGDWWIARNDVKVTYSKLSITVDAPLSIQGLTLELPNGKNIILPEVFGEKEFDYSGKLIKPESDFFEKSHIK